MTSPDHPDYSDPSKVIPVNTFDPVAVKVICEAYCKRKGLVWNEAMWQAAQPTITLHQLTTEQTVAALYLHIDAVALMFDPKAYNWKGRIAMAAHFIFNFRR